MDGLKVASWPGSGGDLNPFINIFVDALEGIGCEVVNVEKFPAKDFPEESVLVVHWPQFIYKESFGKWSKVATLLQFLTLLLRLKKTGVRIVWICHDLEPHDRNEWIWKALWWPTLRIMFLMSDGIITLSPKTMTFVQQHYSQWIRGRLDWAWHPKYENALASPQVGLETRMSLGVSEQVSLIGFFGQLRSQKGVEDLVRVFRMSDDPAMHLLIAGMSLNSAAAVSEYVINASKNDQRIHAIIKRLEDDEISNLVAACKLCVFPYRKYFHSGAMIYCLSAHRRLLTPRTPFSESLAEVLPDWVDLYEGELTPETLWASAKKQTPETPPDLSPFSGRALAEKVLELAKEA